MGCWVPMFFAHNRWREELGLISFRQVERAFQRLGWGMVTRTVLYKGRSFHYLGAVKKDGQEVRVASISRLETMTTAQFRQRLAQIDPYAVAQHSVLCEDVHGWGT